MGQENQEKQEAAHAATGKQGEDMAARLLALHGYRVLGRNLRLGRAEVDILAHDPTQDELVLVEVKTRTSTAFGFPETHVSDRKRELYQAFLEEYRELNGYTGRARCDIVALVLLADGWRGKIFRGV
jgi:putative endonuclease